MGHVKPDDRVVERARIRRSEGAGIGGFQLLESPTRRLKMPISFGKRHHSHSSSASEGEHVMRTDYVIAAAVGAVILILLFVAVYFGWIF